MVARKANLVIRGLELSILPLGLGGGERRSAVWIQLSVVNNLINLAYAMKHP